MSERKFSKRLILQGGIVVAGGILLEELLRRNKVNSKNVEFAEENAEQLVTRSLASTEIPVQENLVKELSYTNDSESSIKSDKFIEIVDDFLGAYQSEEIINKNYSIGEIRVFDNIQQIRGRSVLTLKKLPVSGLESETFKGINKYKQIVGEIEVKNKKSELVEKFGLAYPPKLEVFVRSSSYSYANYSKPLILETPVEKLLVIPQFVYLSDGQELLVDKYETNINNENFRTPFEELRILQERARGFGGPFYWPVEFEEISTYFSKYDHEGVDLVAPYGHGIISSADGVVSGMQRLGYSYGWYLAINHQNGFSSLYAHTSDMLVEVGQKVERGDLIARVGSTGRSTGPHVHFEIHDNGRPVDPLNYLS